MMSGLEFRKSSYSAQGQECVEVAHVPDFHKSSHSGQDQNCVEATALPTGAALRDSKHPELGHLAFPPTEWDAFLTTVRTSDL
ncbi:DUF397 domain-containing protein [Nocardiopsis halophila]|uniref:DUF397 domain-containing protein n=1 Tax=Nocardiopsis halophila TaxID=141692 RepID=UPI000477F47A|nr:DUF397 domain-containing protein [Nocardiopsis halophila]